MDARDAPHLRSIHSTVAASSHHRQSDPFPQNNLDYPNHPKFWSDPNVSKSARYQSTPAQELRDNELEVALSFENRDGFNGIALMDTGAKDNWISDSLCRQLILPRKSFREEIFEGFGGTPVGCNESVHGYWHYGHQTFPITFKISKDLPVNVLFGLDLLRQVNLVNFKEDNKANLEKVLILTKLKAKKDEQQQDAAHQAEERSKAKKAERWEQMSKNSQWTWDENERRFWKTDASNGAKIWTTEKW